MLNEFAYCPRLGYLEWVQGEFADSADTVEGRFHHRRGDRSRQRRRPRGEEDDAPPLRIHERSVLLGSDELGLSANNGGAGVPTARQGAEAGDRVSCRA